MTSTENEVILKLRQSNTVSLMLVTALLLQLCMSKVDAGSPQSYQSRNFQLYTDLSEADAKELLVRLETMVHLVSAYFGKPIRKPIRMFVVDNLEDWSNAELSQMHPDGLRSIQTGGGLTVTEVQGIIGGPKIDADAIVYAVSARQTPQHEAVHAYCGITFGSTGPVWYSEGMAEVGKYWADGEKGVNASQYVIDYLRSHPPKPLMEIVNNPLEQTGDSWQNYAWRWALCHLLGFNENYTKRFKPLGLALLADQNISFAKVYGSQAQEIEFEYLQFLEHLSRGYRCDLCSWDWQTKFRVANPRTPLISKILSERGWQASRAIVKSGQSYAVEAKGTWALSSESDAVDAGGDVTGKGRLVGTIFSDYKLSEEFEIGDADNFTAPADGNLFLRCRDDWSELADNDGVIEVRIQSIRSVD